MLCFCVHSIKVSVYNMVKLYAWGTNSNGQLALGFSSELVALPQEICVPKELVPCLQEAEIYGGGNHTIIRTTNGNIYGAGLNDCGQLAACNSAPLFNTFTAIEVPSIEKVFAVSCGWDFTVFLLENTTLLGCGSNKFKQLGYSCEEKCIQRPVQIKSLQDIAQVSTGLRHTSAITKSGELLVWGDEKHIKAVPGLLHFDKVACGQKHIVALKNGNICAWGSNTHGQCGIDPNLMKSLVKPLKIEWDTSNGNIKDLCCGWTHTLLLTDRGHVFSWGRNSYGQLGRESGPLFLPERIPGLEHIVSIVSGSEHCMALDAKGQLWTWGWNEHGSCGTGDTLNQVQPVNITHHFPSNVLSIGCGAGHCFALVNSK